MTENIHKTIRQLAIKNALEHNGTAKFKAVLSMFLSNNVTYRSKVNEIKGIIIEILNEINSIPVKELESIYSTFIIKPNEKKKNSEYKELPPLKDVDNFDKIIMRLAPYPSGPLHIGNARMAILNDYYVKRYNGKLILVFDDTIGSTVKNIIPEAYEMILDDLRYLNVEWQDIIYKSDRINKFYEYCKKLIELDKAYVCTCEAQHWREKHKITQKPCIHRSLDVNHNLDEWDKMLNNEYTMGEAVVRLKTGMKLRNPALRDHIIMRISNKIHPRVKDRYNVWPLLEFSWAIDDHLLDITHILRGKDLVKEDIIESKIWNIFGWTKAEFIHYGLISFKGIKLSKTEARIKIEKGVYNNWSDPRIWSIQSLKKRGILSKSIRKMILELGLSLADIQFSSKNLYSINRSEIDHIANRYFFITNPTIFTIKNIQKDNLNAKILLHPDFPERGYREINLKSLYNEIKLYIDIKDAMKLDKNEILRLKDLINIKIIDKKNYIAEFLSNGIDEFRDYVQKMKKRLKIIHWLPINNNISVDIIDVNGMIISGIAEKNCNNLKVDQLIQFERFGFCKIDKVEPKILAYFSHP